MSAGSGCEKEGRAKYLAKATAEKSLLTISNFGSASCQPDSRQQQVSVRGLFPHNYCELYIYQYCVNLVIDTLY